VFEWAPAAGLRTIDDSFNLDCAFEKPVVSRFQVVRQLVRQVLDHCHGLVRCIVDGHIDQLAEQRGGDGAAATLVPWISMIRLAMCSRSSVAKLSAKNSRQSKARDDKAKSPASSPRGRGRLLLGSDARRAPLGLQARCGTCCRFGVDHLHNTVWILTCR
jgi:hypothetical protein